MVREISAAELDTVCRKCVRLVVSDVKPLGRVLDSMGIEYNILSPTQADVFANVNLSGLVNALTKESCELIAAQERDESLESYYVNLVGGARHD